MRNSVARWRHDPTRLLQVLREVQEDCGYVPPRAMSLVARCLRLPLSRVKGVAGFYSFLPPSRAARYRVLFCDNITDRMLGSEALMDALCQQLWVEPGKVVGGRAGQRRHARPAPACATRARRCWSTAARSRR